MAKNRSAKTGGGEAAQPLAQPVKDPRQMFLVAAGYEEATDLIGHHSVERVMAGGPAATLIPRAMLSAFTLELYLKCLILLETGKTAQKVHGIVELFGTVSALRQAEIRTAFNADFRRPKSADICRLGRDAHR